MRHRFRQTLFTLALASAGMMLTLPASAAPAPVQQQTQVPGYYRMMLGNLEVTALYDGYINLETKLFHGISEPDMQKLLNRMFIDSKSGMQTAVNAFLVNTGSHLVLVDAGTAQCFGPTMGAIKSNLRAAGYQPEQVDMILLTHLHPDHACGITDQGKAAFPNATVYAAKADGDYWLNKEVALKAPQDAQPIFKLIQDAVTPYAEQGKLKLYSPGEQLLPELEVIATPGHTPGHSSYLFSAGGQKLLIWGDIVHSHSLQFTNPEVAIDFDTDTKQAIATRQKVFADAAENKLWIGGAHLPFPGLGHVRTEGKGYAWVPVEYAPVASLKP
ncbi:glyoxylase-like metal-dependent hydrolase (beta-lactamase superfamily II) [Serratia fonticola]|uniref:Glyoxylase-like metal-dependent hydrolase (Beta-lactamase superfamily II) n=1 Tax=Serratia fonticola TaxID=47917 RepID=A0A542D4W0_SERFO|nr:MBL fold metallo-hydrolase [Serratia fonticola]TQI79890.1 glyoxylase-like metal-dependent hydrolase (beta-lactamase superfamily II) [Serratia fonticola]TQI98085.1 glyoxylase-like metal-dependent hydrolase (beta-lactamase superfamily II) [Serratia fonticola]TVZ67613.1 glyoxylase-like metal-dependent hydrolase (beta-lactamase superfamily II) [Serratia fonticola]